jgi:hypothetical protein
VSPAESKSPVFIPFAAFNASTDTCMRPNNHVDLGEALEVNNISFTL